ncbi:vacuolar assembling protein VPS41 [Pluteus cervinus]|uniref:Vacuolar assembling protein VPS41 n=1 Tax=Pluteus cervinus TaxID=181527 RepID=A0ACD3AWU0_9AGAR|nr:vacuolar assembling protein VPS41 [Pluteus cervinus]
MSDDEGDLVDRSATEKNGLLVDHAHARLNGKGRVELQEDVDSGDDEDDEDDEDDDEDEDDEEPSLKYERIGGALPDLLKKDAASAITIANSLMALGTHSGIVHILDLTGKRIKSYKPHLASVTDIGLDVTGDFVATSSMDGQVVIHSLSTPEAYAFDVKRPMKTVAMEPNFAKKGTRSFVSGGMSGDLILREKGWLGHKDTILHSGEGPIYQTRWKGRLIAWSNDLGVKLYDTSSQTRISYIDRPPDSPRADLFKCTLYWQDETTLLIAWADHIKVARVRSRIRGANNASANLPPVFVEITAVFQLDCMMAGLIPHPTPAYAQPPVINPPDPATSSSKTPQTPTSFLVLAYTTPDDFTIEKTDDKARQARKAAERPELRLISRSGEELTVDALDVSNYKSWACNDYNLAEVVGRDGVADADENKCYVVMSPRDLVLVKPRDKKDHVQWLLERGRYEEALDEVEKIEAAGGTLEGDATLKATEIGQKYVEYLVSEGDFVKAARLCPKVCAGDSKRWEDWIFVFSEKHQLQAIIPYVPTETPRLDHLVYEMMLAHFLTHDRQTLLTTVKEWPREIYDISAVIVAVQGELDKANASSRYTSGPSTNIILMECLAELYLANRQPGKALPYYLRLRRPNVFELIRENNLFTDVQDQVLLLVEFDHELREKRKKENLSVLEGRGEAITLLVDKFHSIPIAKVVQQLKSRDDYLFLYLDAMFEKDPHLVANFADLQVKLYAQHAPTRLVDFLRASSSYSLEAAYKVCEEKEFVPEMVYLLGKMGNNKQALMLIIERMGDVYRAIDFAKQQNDNDLWEDLLMYSETRPAFIRGLLEHVGPEIEPIRLIRRIRNGLEIPGLKEALIKILQDFHLQISLLEGCQAILNSDSAGLSQTLQHNQTGGFFLSGTSNCMVCKKALQGTSQGLMLLFLCRHVVHASCAKGGDVLPNQPDFSLGRVGYAGSSDVGGKIAFEAMIRTKLSQGCPVCHKKAEGRRLI